MRTPEVEAAMHYIGKDHVMGPEEYLFFSTARVLAAEVERLENANAELVAETHRWSAADKDSTRQRDEQRRGLLQRAETAEARLAELERQMQHHPSVAQFRIAELEAQNARLREGLDAVATMPEYDQDDAHRLRNIAKVELAETGEAK